MTTTAKAGGAAHNATISTEPNNEPRTQPDLADLIERARHRVERQRAHLADAEANLAELLARQEA